LLPNETYYVENIKSTNFILGTNTKSMNLWIHKLVIFNQTMKIYAHEEKYSNLYYYCMRISIFWNGLGALLFLTDISSMFPCGPWI
jgi:hypothetical protein